MRRALWHAAAFLGGSEGARNRTSAWRVTSLDGPDSRAPKPFAQRVLDEGLDADFMLSAPGGHRLQERCRNPRRRLDEGLLSLVGRHADTIA